MDHIRTQLDLWLERDKESMIDFLSALVRCKTPSPPGDTRQAVSLVKKFLSSHNLSFKEISAEQSMPTSSLQL